MKITAMTSAALLAIGLGAAATSTPANAAPALGGAATFALDSDALAANLVEPATYYGYGYHPYRRRHYGYHPYRRRYYKPHYYHAPRAYGYYGYRY